MKIEKLNDNQIRCTLTRDDLAKRNLRISELAYGTEKTQSLFREMVKQADYEYGFETENSPLVVEAIPMNSECIVLIITKVDDPEELDTRFSRFSPYYNSDDEEDYDGDEDYLSSLFDGAGASEPTFGDMLKEALDDDAQKRSFVFSFDTISRAMDFSAQARGFEGESTLQKTSSGEYIVTLSKGTASITSFRNVCLLASEYGKGRSVSESGFEFLREHNEILISENAIGKLSGTD